METIDKFFYFLTLSEYGLAGLALGFKKHDRHFYFPLSLSVFGLVCVIVSYIRSD
jgi:hypothetical protein